MAIDLNSVGDALEQTRQGLDAAGYELGCEDRGGRLLLVVKARPDACEDCLVPKEVMASIVSGELQERGLTVAGIDVIYPSDY